MSEHDRKRTLARQLIATRLGIEEGSVRVEREAPAQFGFHTQLYASVDGEELPVQIKTASFRAATVVAIADPGVQFGLDVRDLHPDDAAVREMQHHSHLVDEENVLDLLDHWTRVQAVREADERGLRVLPDHIRLDAGRRTGWAPDRRVRYRLMDLSRDGWVVTLAYHVPEE